MKDPLRILGKLFVGNFDDGDDRDDIGFYLDDGWAWWIFFLPILIGLSPIIITLIVLGGK